VEAFSMDIAALDRAEQQASKSVAQSRDGHKDVR
jgi:hypothetical protein